MFYDAATKDHGLPHDPFKALVVPRPIGWISTLDSKGIVNVAPYSFFNAVATDPPIVMFASALRKDSQKNAEETGEFVCNLAGWEQKDQMNITASSVDSGVDESVLACLETLPSHAVSAPRIAGAPAHLECVYLQTVPLADRNGQPHFYSMILGEVVGVHIDDRFLVDGRVDTIAMRPIARLGYDEYAVVDEVFRLERPG